MYEGNSRSRPRAQARRSGVAARIAQQPDRIALWAVAMAVIAMIVAGASAHAGSGGTGTGGTSGGGGSKYDRIWHDFTRKQKRWARRTSDCESGGRAHIDSGDYHGAFQFLLSTWRNAPKSPGGDAHKYPWRTQAVVAVLLKKRDGAKTYWPNCG